MTLRHLKPKAWADSKVERFSSAGLKGRACIVWRRFSDSAMPFDGLSTLTQLTRFATDYASSVQRQKLCCELAQLTKLKELDAPTVVQSEGEQLRLTIITTWKYVLGCACATIMCHLHI